MVQPSSRRRSQREGNSNMKVVVRVRPLNSVEVSKQSSTSVRVMDERVLVFDPKDDSIDYFQGDQRRRKSQFLTRRARDLRFMFDRVFDRGASNRDVFEQTTNTIIDGVLGGYNCSVFAYGATGAGKTFTMLGDSTNPGVMFLTMMELYSKINASKDEKSSDVAVSYLEVYNETIRDLLMPGQPLAVREDPVRGVCVSGLTLHKPVSAEELLGMLEFGNNNRTQHPTDANAQSSRSHAVFQVFVRQRDRTASLKAKFTMGKMSLIDLAGSERAIVTSNSGARFREGANINKSLLALGNCINALSDKENKAGHIPYRDSKLTRLLKDSLGGNCRTVMIAAVSPSDLSYEDTYNTLKYADRAMNIKCKVIKNEVSVDMHVSRYAKIVEELRLEISDLKSRLFGSESAAPVVAVKSAESNKQNVEEIQKLKSSLQCVIKERMVVRRNIIDIEAAERDLQEKRFRKERTLKRMQMVCVEGERLYQAEKKMQSYTDAVKSKQNYLGSKKADFQTQIARNDTWLKRIHSEIMLESDADAKDQLEQCHSVAELQLDNKELRRDCQLYKRHIAAQEKDAQNTESLLLKVLSLVKRQFFLLKGVGLATQDLTEEHNNIIDLVESQHKVTWADQSLKENDIADVSFMLQSFLLSSTGTPQTKTPIRKRRFNTPVFDLTTPCQGALSVSVDAKRTFASSATANMPAEDINLANTCISLTKRFEAFSPAAESVKTMGQSSTGQGPIASSIVISGVQPNRKDVPVTPFREPLSLANSTCPATLRTPINLNKPSKFAATSSTPLRIGCWADKPTVKDTKGKMCSAKPLRESNSLDISGMLPLQQSPEDQEQYVKPVSQMKRSPVNDPLSTPLRELPVNKKTEIKGQLPSILSQLTNPLSKDKSKNQQKSKDMMPKRVSKATKENENVQLSKTPLRSSSSVLELDRLHSKKIKKHINGLRRAVSSTSIGTSRTFAPRSSAIYQNLPKTKI
ncbi:kinesin-like protein KIF18A isoform X2 [Acropora millepora]|uniref:kinesin-like protein KIF18A isoform X2 n=1 Tax=Acropora millepora TaxID=45264 RepID=UPI001CF504D7|nr:kinesin-like protein KIF18A isoform X2 [Acropora millepora]